MAYPAPNQPRAVRAGLLAGARRSIRLLLVLALVLTAAAQTAPPGKPSVCAQVGDISSKLAEITGWRLTRPVPCDIIGKARINQYLKETMEKETSPEEVRANEIFLKKFGFAPPDFDLAKSTLDLLTEQAAAFYDYHRKKLFIGEAAPTGLDETVLAHELAHALADQHFNLSRYVRKGQDSDDGSAARLAVMEGQATWIMSEYFARKLGQSLLKNPSLAAMMSGASDVASGQFPVFDQAPLYFRTSLLFPYTKGILYQSALLARDGVAGFAEPFERAPVSTQQIIHPEKYFQNVLPTRPALPDAKLPGGYKRLISGAMGELDQAILMEQYDGKELAGSLAPHLRGSAFEVRENKKAGRAVLLFAAEWDSPGSARDYFAFYRNVLAKKWKRLAVTAESPAAVSGMGDDGRFEIRLTGAIFTSVEGLPPAVN